ncbi:DUF4280 domain-containing protein [Polyangium jinanense]|uniref:DUF4280 domain-containing protein n=1 Tax=Polyangium jinanense TaxID=2829994 RepID=A0A9X3X9L5_9BACT|nr:DUF4280 domain-containing protein [Polyangium jinanense]MDC3953881.1 DUF4280 domain-containing protein [Polyangium jinanense]MDC3983881.1 DUF4280 domain-containing protein [Polyangium jinanense]
MAVQIASGATAMCSFGMAPASIMVLPANMVNATASAANIADMVTATNVLPFGACTSMANPTVASATAAAMGVLTPMPCVPVPAGTWLPGSTKVMLKSLPTLHNSCQLMCSYGGVIQILSPGQFKVMAGG